MVNGAKLKTEQPNDGLQSHVSNDDNDTKPPLVSVRSYQDYPSTHLNKTNFVLPHPTRPIYNMVLLSYAKESGPFHIAEQAEDIVWSMNTDALRRMNMGMMQQPHTQQVEAGDGINGMLLPSTQNWNSVLKCWSRSTDPDRAFRSYSFLLSWIEWNDKFREVLVSKTMDTAIISFPDDESYDLVLQSCLIEAGKEEELDETEIQRAKEMGSGVASRLWKDMLDNSNNSRVIESRMYHQIIHAICQNLPPKSLSNKALAALARVYAQCHKDKLVTAEIYELVKATTTEQQFARILRAAN